MGGPDEPTAIGSPPKRMAEPTEADGGANSTGRRWGGGVHRRPVGSFSRAVILAKILDTSTISVFEAQVADIGKIAATSIVASLHKETPVSSLAS
jgi:hypothetical protein